VNGKAVVQQEWHRSVARPEFLPERPGRGAGRRAQTLDERSLEALGRGSRVCRPRRSSRQTAGRCGIKPPGFAFSPHSGTNLSLIRARAVCSRGGQIDERRFSYPAGLPQFRAGRRLLQAVFAELVSRRGANRWARVAGIWKKNDEHGRRVKPGKCRYARTPRGWAHGLECRRPCREGGRVPALIRRLIVDEKTCAQRPVLGPHGLLRRAS